MTSSNKREIEQKEASRPGGRLPELVYLHEFAAEGVIPKVELRQLPFPVSKLNIALHDDMILECVQGHWYMRSLVESLLVIPVYARDKYLTQDHFDEVGLEIQSEWSVNFLAAETFGTEFLVAWLPGHKKPPVTFLPATQFEGLFDDIPRELHLAYRTADRNRKGYMSKSYGRFVSCVMSKEKAPKAVFNAELFPQEAKEQAELNRLEQALNPPSLPPIPTGPWEQGIEHDIFGGDPSAMTDDEFEMVYGRPR